MSGGPEVSVVVPACGEDPRLEDCLRSLRLQKTHAPYEVLVVSPSEADAQLVREAFPGFRLVRLPSRAYPGRARNANHVSRHDRDDLRRLRLPLRIR